MASSGSRPSTNSQRTPTAFQRLSPGLPAVSSTSASTSVHPEEQPEREQRKAKKPKRPEDFARAVESATGSNPLVRGLYSTSNSLAKPSILNTVKRPKEAEAEAAVGGKKVKRADYMTPPPPRRQLDDDNLRALLTKSPAPTSPMLRSPSSAPPICTTMMPRIDPGSRGSAVSQPLSPVVGHYALVPRGGFTSPTMGSPSGSRMAFSAMVETTEEPMDVEDRSSPFWFISKLRAQAAASEDASGPESKEFVYLKVVKPTDRSVFNPYNLRVVSHDKIDPDNYCTMSSKGVTHLIRQDADFTPLGQWVREHGIFHSMFQIPFFRKFRRWKTFYFWRKYIRRTTINKYKDYLEDNLFILNRELCRPLLQVRRLCLEIQTIPMYKVTGPETETLERYCQAQGTQRDRTHKELLRITQKISGILSDACKLSLKAHSDNDQLRSLTEETTAAESTAALDLEGTSTSASAAATASAKKKSEKRAKTFKDINAVQLLNVNPVDQPYRRSYTELSQKRAECRRLTSYIRLADYMVIDSVVALTMKSLSTLRDALLYPKPIAAPTLALEASPSKADHSAKPGAKALHDSKVPLAARRTSIMAVPTMGGAAKKSPEPPAPTGLDDSDEESPLPEGTEPPIFMTEVLFRDDTIVITPNREAYEFRVDGVIKGFTDTVLKIERFLHMEEFKAYTEPVMADQGEDSEFGMGPDVSLMLSSEADYKSLTLSVKDSLGAAFRDVEAHVTIFDVFKRMYLENRRMDPQKIKSEEPPLDWFREQMDKYKQQHREVEAMRKRAVVGLFLVVTKRLKEFFQPSPVNCLAEIHALLPVLAREQNAKLLSELTDAVRILNEHPTSVEEFVSYLQFHQHITERIEGIEQEFENIKETYMLADMEGVHVAQEDNLAFQSGTVPLMQKLRLAITFADDSKEANIRKFAAEIDERLTQLKARVDDVHSRAENQIISDEEANMEEVITYVTDLQKELEQIKQTEKTLTGYQELFGVDISRLEVIFEVITDVNNKVKLWTGLRDWIGLTRLWNETVFQKINPDDVGNELQKYVKLVNQVSRALPANPVVFKLKALVDEFKMTLPVIQCLRNPALQKHHFAKIDEIVQRELSKEPDYTLGVLIELKVMDLKDDIQNVSNTATQEAALEDLLAKVQKLWTGGGVGAKPVEFIVSPYKDFKDVYVLGAVDDVITQLEDSGVIISTVVSSRFCTGGLRTRTEQWDRDIRYMNETLDKWLEFQRNWMYLESIFNSPEITRQWPQDSKTFSTVDKQWKELMKKVYENPSVYRILISSSMNLREKFDANNKQLERILSNLEKKLEEKRRHFPRFYFLSNDDLLDILAQIKNPAAVQPHLLKMFDNIKKLEFGANATDVMAMESSEGEVVPLSKPVKARGEVEKWLSLLEQSMVQSLRRLAKLGFQDYDKRPRTEWIFEHPAQIVLTLSQVFWCAGVQAALETPGGGGLDALKEFQQACYQNLTDLAALTGKSLSRIERGMLTTLITMDVHSRDLTDQMVAEGVTKVSDFGWRKQLRAYWENRDDGSGDVMLRQNNSEFTYGYEYQGCQPRLVITPLTDRIYMTVTGALRLCLGAAPSGPAGTGKTETVKDMAKSLAFQCIVYNCSDGVTYKMMEKFFSGLAQTGAWCCLDEFNRINIEVLSVIATQLAEIRQGLLVAADRITFQGTPDVVLKKTFGAFITMNPGYAGRTELPDNLKVLFRPVAVMTPDFRMIAEVILFSEGYKDAKSLSLKITQLFKLSSEQLSPQDHYDFGMRALKSILVMAGGLKRNNPDIPEDVSLIRACRDANIPKFVSEDIPLFNGILSDLFPGVNLPSHDYGDLQVRIDEELAQRKLQFVPAFNLKITQFYETLIVRHGVMIVGQTMSGKTTNRDIMKGALTKMRALGSRNKFAQPVQEFAMNPKSITYGELYGEMNVLTNEWRDGVLPIIAKQVVSDPSEDLKWIIFDGPVDTLWIESMNSVLDDSKLLCLD
eukprot:RCo004476